MSPWIPKVSPSYCTHVAHTASATCSICVASGMGQTEKYDGRIPFGNNSWTECWGSEVPDVWCMRTQSGFWHRIFCNCWCKHWCSEAYSRSTGCSNDCSLLQKHLVRGLGSLSTPPPLYLIKDIWTSMGSISTERLAFLVSITAVNISSFIISNNKNSERISFFPRVLNV